MAATLELAISAIRSGRTEEGRQLLNLLIQENPNNAKAWLWMSSVVNTDEQRARCLYHVLAIDPNSELARRGLSVLGIVVSDSRPVKIPRDSKPIQIPNPTSGQERRPFLIDPQAITKELPFTPITEKVEASPSVLAIDVGSEVVAQSEENVSQERKAEPHSAQTVSVVPPTQPKETETQPLPDQVQQTPSEPVPVVSADQAPKPVPQPQTPSEPVPVQHVAQPGMVSQPQSNPGQPQAGIQMQSANLPNAAPPSDPNVQPSVQQSQPSIDANQQSYGQPAPNVPVPNQTRPSQPVPVVGQNPNMGTPYNDQAQPFPPPSQGVAGHANVTMGMPTQQPQNPSQPMPPPIHSNTTMGMPLPAQNQQPQRPSEPVPVVSWSGPMGMSPYGPQPMPPPQYQQSPALHSNSTMMMPTYSEAEARARLAASQSIPIGNPNFGYQSGGMMGDPMVHAYGSMPHAHKGTEEDDEEGVNILAVIIFGTLSVTALGGLGMLILLVFTSPPV